MTEIFAVKVSCPALFVAVEMLAKEAGYKWSIPCCPNSKNSYIGFRDNKTLDTSSYKECLKNYNVVYNASTQFEEIRKRLGSSRSWPIGKTPYSIKFISGRLYINGCEMGFDVIKEIYDTMSHSI